MKRLAGLFLSLLLAISPAGADGLGRSVTPQTGGAIDYQFDGGIASSNSGPAFTFNVTKANTAKFRAAVAAMNAGSRNAMLVTWGDSIVRGQSTGAGTAQWANGWPSQLVSRIRALGYNSANNNLFGSGGQWGLAANMANVETGDVRVTHTGAWAVGANITGGGLNYQSTAAGGMTFTPPENVTKFNVWFRDNTAGRSFTWRVDAGATTQVDSLPIDQVRRIDIDAGALGAHSVTLDWVLGTPVPLAINAYSDNASRKEISVYNWGHSGASSTVLASTTFTAASGMNFLPLLLPDLTIIEGGIGNSWRTSISIAQTKSDVTAMVIKAKSTGGDVLLIVTPWDSSGSGNAAQQSDYNGMLYQVAVEQNVGLIDFRTKRCWTSTADEVSCGFVSDTVHPTSLGYADIASIVGGVIAWTLQPSTGPPAAALLSQPGTCILAQIGSCLMVQ